jgi:hypothetical protein
MLAGTETQPMTLAWGTDGSAAVETVEELDRELDKLTREAERDDPFVAELVSPEHGTLSIGLGRPETVLSYVPASQDPPYYASRGAGGTDGYVEFFFQGSLSEYPRESAVPIDVGREAMRRFFERPHALPANVEWQEV